jgi:hypothetical protein
MDLGRIKTTLRPEWNRCFDCADDADGADAKYPTTQAPSGRTGICAVVRGRSCCRRAFSENRQAVREGEGRATPRRFRKQVALAAFTALKSRSPLSACPVVPITPLANTLIFWRVTRKCIRRE